MNIRKNNEERRPIYFPFHLIYDKYCSALNVNLLKRGKSNEKTFSLILMLGLMLTAASPAFAAENANEKTLSFKTIPPFYLMRAAVWQNGLTVFLNTTWQKKKLSVLRIKLNLNHRSE